MTVVTDAICDWTLKQYDQFCDEDDDDGCC